MKRRYSLDTKIDALNQIEQHEGDITLISDILEIPARTLRGWLQEEKQLRQRYQERETRRGDRLLLELRLGMLERSQAILQRLDEDKLAKAPLNQLASALGTLLGSAMKLQEAKEEANEGEKTVIRYEHYYDGSLQSRPPWAGASEGFDRSLQDRGVWEALGQDGAGQDRDPGSGSARPEALLVAGADAADVEPGLARFESEHAQNGRRRHQRERAAH